MMVEHSCKVGHVADVRAARPVASLLCVALDEPTRAACAALASDPAFRALAGRLDDALAFWRGKMDYWDLTSRIGLPLPPFWSRSSIMSTRRPRALWKAACLSGALSFRRVG